MQEAPEEMTLAKLEVLVMPTGEVMCLGGVIGDVSQFGKYLSDLRNAITGEAI